MNKFIWKRFSVYLSAMSIVAILFACSGCGGGGSSDGVSAYTSDSTGGSQTAQTTASVDGKVTDENGNVVQDAVVTWDVQGYCENQETPGTHPDVTSTTTGSSGSFLLQGVPVGKRVIYAFNGTKMGAMEVDVSKSKQKYAWPIQLDQIIGSISGKVKGQNGEPVSAYLYFEHSNPLYKMPGQSGTDGSYKFFKVPLGTSRISVTPFSQNTYLSAGLLRVDPEPTYESPNVTFNITLYYSSNPTPTPTSTSTPTPTVSPTASPTPTSGGGGGGGGGDTPTTKTFIALGTFTKYNDGSDHACRYMARIKTDGTFDSTFNSSGTGGNAQIICATEQSDGKIMIGGDMTGYNDGSDHSCGRITRLSKNGAFDGTFGGLGTGFDNTVRGITLTSNGKYLVQGIFTTYNDDSNHTCNYFALLNSDGTYDNTFNAGGTGFNGEVTSQPTGYEDKGLLGGKFTSYNDGADHPVGHIIRINSDGTYDGSFNAGGTGFNGDVVNLGIQNDGKLIVFGKFTSYNDGADHPCGGIARLNLDGSYDIGFKANGIGFNDFVNGITTLDDGSYLVGGNFTTYDDGGAIHNCKYLAKLKSDGTYDDSFTDPLFNAFCQGLVIPSENKIITIGSFTKYNDYNCGGIAKLNLDGSYDTTFNSSGTGFDGNPTWYVLQTGSKILTFGNFTKYNDGPDHTCGGIARLNSNGTYDTSFNRYGSGFNGNVWTLFYF